MIYKKNSEKVAIGQNQNKKNKKNRFYKFI